MKHIVYLCDRKACIIDGQDRCQDYCKHTQNPDHAINGPCEDPERFDAIETNIGIVYKEKEDYVNDELNEEASK